MALAFPGQHTPQVAPLLSLGGDKGKVNKPRGKSTLLLPEILPPLSVLGSVAAKIDVFCYTEREIASHQTTN